MTERERFLAVASNAATDYVPIFGFDGAPGMSGGCMKHTHARLVETGMPAEVGGCLDNWVMQDVEGWRRYWGTAGVRGAGIAMAWGAQGFKVNSREEDGYVISESETGEVTREVVDNANLYTMPEFVSYSVRDRSSWEFFAERTKPCEFLPIEEVREYGKLFVERDQPVTMGLSGAYAHIRGLMGPLNAGFMFFDDPELIHDIMARLLHDAREYTFPVIESVKPDVVQMGEDLCFNNGMLLSPEQFHEFFGQYYQEVCDCAHACGVPVIAVDTDGDAMEYTAVAEGYGVNAIFPYEVKAGNDLFVLRERHPEFTLLGGLEKEVVNEGNEEMIEEEIMSKVPALLEKGRYFPNGDHGMQPMVTFDNMCRFMTLLHEVTDNPEGAFPRM